MPTVRIDLREGFADDDVRIEVDGETVYEASGVATDYSIGLAGAVHHDVADGRHLVAVVARGATARHDVEVAGDEVRLGVVLDDGAGPTITPLGRDEHYL